MLDITLVRDVKVPSRGTKSSAGIDFYVPTEFERMEVQPGGNLNIPSGVKVAVPDGYALVAFNKSGIATKKGLQVGACVVDSDYQGEVHLHVMNVSDTAQTVEAGDKLVQFLLIPVETVGVRVVLEAELYKEVSARGTGAFGSTGTK